MLKIRNVLFVLTLSPLFLLWQLPGHAQTSPRNSPSRGTAGSESGAPTNASQTSVVSNPQTGATIPVVTITTTTGENLPAVVTSVTTPTGPVAVPIVPNVSPEISTGVSTAGSVSIPTVTTATPVTATTATSAVPNIQLQISAANVELTSPGATITNNATGSGVVINLTPESQTKLNLAATNFIPTVTSTGGTVASVITQGSGTAANTLVSNYTSAGVPNQLVQTLVSSISNLMPPVSANGVLQRNVNINNLNDAIVAYNGIVLQSSPDAIGKLSQDPSFVLIGQTLGELRSALK